MAKCYGELGIVAIGTGLACDTDVHDFHRLLHPDLLISTSGRLIEGISLDEQKAARYKINGFFSEYKVLKERFGNDLIFHGGIENQRILPMGTVDEVREETRACLETLGKGGGYICCSCHNAQAGTPVENILTMIETVKTYRSV